MVWVRTSKLALKIAVWAENLFMKAHIFFRGQSKNDLETPNLLENKSKW